MQGCNVEVLFCEGLPYARPRSLSGTPVAETASTPESCAKKQKTSPLGEALTSEVDVNNLVRAGRFEGSSEGSKNV